jgi:hypothetical protein
MEMDINYTVMLVHQEKMRRTRIQLLALTVYNISIQRELPNFALHAQQIQAI